MDDVENGKIGYFTGATTSTGKKKTTVELVVPNGGYIVFEESNKNSDVLSVNVASILLEIIETADIVDNVDLSNSSAIELGKYLEETGSLTKYMKDVIQKSITDEGKETLVNLYVDMLINPQNYEGGQKVVDAINGYLEDIGIGIMGGAISNGEKILTKVSGLYGISNTLNSILTSEDLITLSDYMTKQYYENEDGLIFHYIALPN